MAETLAHEAEAVSDGQAQAAVERVYRDDSARILASLIRACGGDFELAEDAMQEAMAVALERWPRDGVPDSPSAWLITTGRRKAIDRLRGARRRSRGRTIWRWRRTRGAAWRTIAYG